MTRNEVTVKNKRIKIIVHTYHDELLPDEDFFVSIDHDGTSASYILKDINGYVWIAAKTQRIHNYLVGPTDGPITATVIAKPYIIEKIYEEYTLSDRPLVVNLSNQIVNVSTECYKNFGLNSVNGAMYPIRR